MERLGAPWSHSERPAHLQGKKTQLQSISGLEPLLSIDDLAECLGVPVATIYHWRVDGRVPAAFRVERHVNFTRSDVLGRIDAQRESRPGGKPDER